MASLRPPFTQDDLAKLETARVKLVLYSEEQYNDQLFATVAKHPELTEWTGFNITPESVQYQVNADDTLVFAIIDKTKGPDGAFAGTIGFMRTSLPNLSIEIGPVICLPDFQRTFVTSNAIGILLRYALNTAKDGGLGFRRVQWTTNEENVASVRAAERLGFKKEGVLRWNTVLGPEKKGLDAPEERGSGRGRHTVMLAVCWDDWEDGGRELVDGVVDRRS
ncbi:N-acetyltransferase domain-containing protein [Mycena kentingensis (nom. inval.)]|nr:N-acetyltransferase domain-containing protein [Mycena kentingensis (nom. inval.)]